MYAKSTRPSAKREVQNDRSAKRDDQIARLRRVQACELRAKRAMRICPQSGQIFLYRTDKVQVFLAVPTKSFIKQKIITNFFVGSTNEFVGTAKKFCQFYINNTVG